IALAAIATIIVGCSRGAPDATLPSASAPASAPTPAPTPAPAPAPVEAPPSGEAHRSAVSRLEDDPSLRPHLATLRDHFGPAAGPFLVQHVDLAQGRSAVLVARADEGDPIVIAFDRDQALWVKPHPAGGIVGPVKHLTLAPKPDGGVVFFAWVASLHLVAARIWADDGNAFGDFQLFSPESCDALSAAYGAGLGWVAVCSSRGGARAQRMREDCTMAWGHDGTPVGATAGAVGPPAIVFDPPSVVVLERVVAVGGGRLLAYRYDADAQPLWSSPSDLGMDLAPSAAAAGSTPTAAGPSGRIEASLARPSVVRVERRTGVAGRPGIRAAEVSAAGEVRFF
ncbi:MAG TPA: hypothetical protein VH044_02330, partial [Polyangiaceae bacterium]|nr:hypothetical protein [Polyangiaceae bacterium]